MGAPKARTPLDPVADLKRRLARAPAGQLRRCVHRWWADHGLGAHPATVGKRIARALIEQRRAAAGIVVLQLLGDHLRLADLVDFSRLYADGHLADHGDRFATAVLATMLDRAPNRADVVRAIATWRGADTSRLRRAACVAFVPRAGDHADVAFAVCAHVVWSHEVLDQEAVGRLLRELGAAEPDRAAAFFRRHARLMSRACARKAVAKLPRRDELLAHHRRARTPRRG